MKTSRAAARQVKALETLEEMYQSIVLELQRQNERLAAIEQMVMALLPAEHFDAQQTEEQTHGNENEVKPPRRQKAKHDATDGGR